MRDRLLDAAFAALLIATALLLAFLSTRFSWQHDFSYAQRASLDTRSVELLKRLDAPIAITSYAPRDNELRGAIADFIARYQHVKRDISLAFVDPDADPAATREAGIQVNGELVIRYQGRSEMLKLLTERELDNALVRLARPHTGLVAFVEGDGERKSDGAANADLGQFAAFLQAQGVRALQLNLTSAQIPENLDVLVIAGPRVPLASVQVGAIVDYVERGGNLLWLTEPDENAGLQPLAQALSLHQLAGTVVDGNGAALGIGDPSFVAISTYPPSPLTRDFALTTLFPQAAALAAIADARWRLTPLLRTGQKSWTQIGAIPKAGDAATISYDADKGEIPGPLDLGFALSRLSPSPTKREQRVVAIGDGDFLSNAFLGNGGNREFGQRVFDWLLADDALIDLPDKGAPDRQLQLTQTQLGVIGLTFLLGLPLMLLVAGGVIYARRRRA